MIFRGQDNPYFGLSCPLILEVRNMVKPVIRLLRENEIECRAAIVRKNGISILLYKDARVRPEDSGRDIWTVRMEEEPPEHRRQSLLHGGDF